MLHELTGGTLLVTLNRPERRNAISWDQIARLAELLGEAALDPAVSAVILTGAGGAFSAGGDVKDQRARRSWGPVERHNRAAPMLDAIRAVWDFPKPLIAAINGVATGAGVGLALLADIRLASREAELGFAFVRVGLGPDYGVSYTLPRAVGPGQAAKLLYSGATIDAETALRIGLVEELHEPGALLPAAEALAAEISARAPYGVRITKEALRRAATMDLATVLRTEMNAQM
ncbi:MAG: enoyl-CoA hydratase/isomerase family protein, partial [Solirubrobacterales bacterium]